jgi:hypothetical protein
MFKVVAVFALVALAATVSAQFACPLSEWVSPINGTGLTICTAFNGKSACCNHTTEAPFAGAVIGLGALGTGNCPTNILTTLCDIICSPNQASFVTLAATPIVSVYANTSNAVYDSCADLCLTPANTTHYFGPFNGTNRGYDLFGVLNAYAPSIAIYGNGTNSTTALSYDVLPAVAADKNCVSAGTTTSTTGGITSTGNTTSSTSGATTSSGTSHSTTSTSTSTSGASSVVFAFASLMITVALLL